MNHLITNKEINMNEMQVFNFEEHEVRTIIKDGEPWFVAKDVAEVLGYQDKKSAIKQHCKKVNKIKGGDSPFGIVDINIIPESDLYRLIMRSNLPSAERFQDWVMDVVLPTIRKTGSYSVNKVEAQPIQHITNNYTYNNYYYGEDKKQLPSSNDNEIIIHGQYSIKQFCDEFFPHPITAKFKIRYGVLSTKFCEEAGIKMGKRYEDGMFKNTYPVDAIMVAINYDEKNYTSIIGLKQKNK